MKTILARENCKGRFTPCCTPRGQSMSRTTRGAKAESRAVGSSASPLLGKGLGVCSWGLEGCVSTFKVGTIQCFWAPSLPSLRELFASLSMHCVASLCLMPYALQILAAIACGNATASPVMGYSLTLPLLNISDYELPRSRKNMKSYNRICT